MLLLLLLLLLLLFAARSTPLATAASFNQTHECLLRGFGKFHNALNKGSSLSQIWILHGTVQQIRQNVTFEAKRRQHVAVTVHFVVLLDEGSRAGTREIKQGRPNVFRRSHCCVVVAKFIRHKHIHILSARRHRVRTVNDQSGYRFDRSIV